MNINKRRKYKKWIVATLILAIFVFCSTLIFCVTNKSARGNVASNSAYEGSIAVEQNNNQPDFTDKEIKRAEKETFEEYSRLDKLGRCGAATATICKEIMPQADDTRSSIGYIYPSGWQSINFWSRCHLIAWQLAGENDNEENLITGTSRMNLSGMLPRENLIASYIDKHPDNHVLYKVEPIFDGENLVASGVHMQARSVEDDGQGLSFNYYVFNYQPGYIINYKDGSVVDDPEHKTVITLADKTATYTGDAVHIDPASVTGSTGDVRYMYFTDSDAKKKTSIFEGAEADGYAPSEKGTYYVRAVVSGDDWYPSAASEIVKLIIY